MIRRRPPDRPIRSNSAASSRRSARFRWYSAALRLDEPVLIVKSRIGCWSVMSEPVCPPSRTVDVLCPCLSRDVPVFLRVATILRVAPSQRSALDRRTLLPQRAPPRAGRTRLVSGPTEPWPGFSWRRRTPCAARMPPQGLAKVLDLDRELHFVDGGVGHIFHQ